MGLLALAHVLLDRPMQRRFESDPRLRATLLLLQERVPKAVAFHHTAAERAEVRGSAPGAETPQRLIASADTPSPEVQLLSNGRYHVMLTNAGAGYSRWKDLAVTRWHEDGTADAWGSFCYLRDTDTGTFWSTTHQPTQWKPDQYEAIFTEGRAEFRRRDQGIDASTEIVVSSTKFKGSLISVRIDDVRMSDGSVVQREVVTHPGAVAIVALDDAGKVVLVNQYRPAIGAQLDARASSGVAAACTRRRRCATPRPCRVAQARCSIR